MTTLAHADGERGTTAYGAPTRWARRVYLLSAGLFLSGIALQVFFAGLGVLVHPRYVALHITFGHSIQWLTLLLLVSGVVARLPRRVQAGNVLLLGLFTLQYMFLGSLTQLLGPIVRGLHAVNALALFWLTLQLIRWAWMEGFGQLPENRGH